MKFTDGTTREEINAKEVLKKANKNSVEDLTLEDLPAPLRISLLSEHEENKDLCVKTNSEDDLSAEEKFIYKFIPPMKRNKYGSTVKEIVRNYIINSRTM